MTTNDDSELDKIFNPVQMDDLGIPRWWVDNAKAAVKDLYAAKTQDDTEVLEMIGERDELEDKLDSLSEAVASYFEQDIGEHSNVNDPWYNAYELLRDNTRPKAQEADVNPRKADELYVVSTPVPFKTIEQTVVKGAGSTPPKTVVLESKTVAGDDELREEILSLSGMCGGPYDTPHRCSWAHCDHCGVCDISEELIDIVEYQASKREQGLLVLRLGELIPYQRIDDIRYVRLDWLIDKLKSNEGTA